MSHSHSGRRRCRIEKIDCSKLLGTTLSGEQEVPPVVTKGSGTGYFHLSRDHRRLKFSIKVGNLSSKLTSAHFHDGVVGVNGDILKPIEFKRRGSCWEACGFWRHDEKEFPLTSLAVAKLLTGGIYVNVHTEDLPPGEIRGQIFDCTESYDNKSDRWEKKDCRPKSCNCHHQRGDLFGHDRFRCRKHRGNRGRYDNDSGSDND